MWMQSKKKHKNLFQNTSWLHINVHSLVSVCFCIQSQFSAVSSFSYLPRTCSWNPHRWCFLRLAKTVTHAHKNLRLFKQTSGFIVSVKWLECVCHILCSLSNDHFKKGLTSDFVCSVFIYLGCTMSQQLAFLCLYRCFLLSHANSCLVSRTLAGMRNTLGISHRTHTGQTCTHAIRSASGRCFNTWGTLSENICFTAMGNCTACGAFLISILLANQSVARQTCMTDWGCTPMSSSPLSKSRTGGPARGSVSKENYNFRGSLQGWYTIMRAREH